EAIMLRVRGVPSVYIDDREVAPIKGSRAGFWLRTYGSPPSLIPDEDTLHREIVAACSRPERHWRAPSERVRAAERQRVLRDLRRFERVVSRPRYLAARRQVALEQAAEQGSTSWPQAWPHSFRAIAKSLAGRDIEA